MSETALVFLWSLPHEPAYIESLEKAFDRVVLVPVRPAAMAAARELVEEDQIIDAHARITSAEKQELERQATARTNAFHAELVKRSKEPWLACLDFPMIGPMFYLLQYWLVLVDRLKQQTGATVVRHHGPFSRTGQPWTAVIDHAALSMVLSSEPPAPTGPRGWWHRFKRKAGRKVNRNPESYARLGDPRDTARGTTDTLICGLLRGDEMAQRNLVDRLFEAGESGFRWLALHDPQADRAMADEKVALNSSEKVQACRDTMPERLPVSWNKPNFADWSRLNIEQSLADAVATAEPALKRFGLPLARLILQFNGNLRLRYAFFERLMNAYNPNLVVGHSVFNDMVFPREWARRNHRHFLMYPHGIRYQIQETYSWDAETIGFFGAVYRDEVIRQHHKNPERMRLVGGMHLAEQGFRFRGLEPVPEKGGPWRVLYLGNQTYLPNYPDTCQEFVDDLLAMAKVVTNAGGLLVARFHPRQIDPVMHHHVEAALREAEVPIEVSDPTSSLAEELQAARIVLSRCWGGAGVMALYAEAPMAGWAPREGLEESTAMLRELPMFFTRPEEILEQLNRLDDASSRKEILVGQKAFLEKHFQDAQDDPWEKAVALFQETRQHIAP